MSRFSWRWWPRRKSKSLDDNRRHLLQALPALAGSGALATLSQAVEAKDASDLPPPPSGR